MTKAISEKCVGMIPFEFSEGSADNEGGLPTSIHLVPIGAWDHDLYGDIVIKAADIKEFIQNFDAKVRKGVFITAGHEGFNELPAVAWITSVEAREDGLWGTPDWNSLGKEALEDKQFKFFSPEFYPTYEDPESHIIYHNVLTGGALTKSPYFKELMPLVMSDKIIHTKHSEKTMDMATLLAKDVASLNDEEKAFIKEHQADLTDEQKVTHKSVIDEAPAETEAEKTAREEKEAGDANEAAGLNRDGSAKVAASEKVMITASELAVLKSAADKGMLAFKELEGMKITADVGKMVFSATNKAGAFLPKEEADLKKFMESLNATQRLAFSGLISKVRVDKEIFNETGAGTKATEGTALAEIETKVAAKMSENKDMKYSEALKIVMSENQGLEERFDSELPSSRRGKE